LITGANSGIGLALTKKILELNNKVLATYRESSKNLNLIKNENLTIVKYDQSKIYEFKDLKEKIKKNSIDLIFNCAGVFGGSFEDQQIEKLDFSKFQEVLMVNSFSILKIMQIILGNETSTKNLEVLVNISSDAGSIKLNNQGNAYIYRASKTALNSITKNMSLDLNARFNTIIFAIDPGNVQSGMNPGGQIKSEVCANLIIDLMSSNVQTLNGKFVNLLGEEIPW
jgi:NAD(P)-dependent dehydrogenase (short-subunit alcohol dehydrogenase family)